MTESQIVGLIIVIVGGLEVARPDILLRFQTWTQKIIMGAKYEPSKRTYLIVRVMGALFIVIGLFALAGFIQ